MKITRKFLAAALISAMVLSLGWVPGLVASAANEAGAMTAIAADLFTGATGFDDVAGSIVTTEAATANTDRTFTGLTAAVVQLTQAETAGDRLKFTATNGAAVEAYKFTSEYASGTTERTLGQIILGNDFAIAGDTVAFGDVIYVVDGDTTSGNSITIKIAKFIIGAKLDSATTISGAGSKPSVAMNVIVPLALNFAIDPYEVLGDSGINSPDFVVYNKTKDIAAKVEFSITATNSGTNSPSFVPTAASAAPPASTANLAYMTVVDARDGTIESNAFKSGTLVYDAAGLTPADKIELARRTTAVPAGTTSGSVTTNFALAASSDGTTVTKAQAASFTFTGAINTAATWANNNLSVSATYTITPMGVDNYNNKNKPLTVGLGAYADSVADYGFGTKLATANGAISATATELTMDPLGSSGPISGSATYTVTKTNIDTAEKAVKEGFNFNFAGLTLKSIWWTDGQGAFAQADSTFTVDSSAGTVKFGSTWAGTEASTNCFYLTLSNDDSFCITVTVT